METGLPFALLGFDYDNGGEFLNHHLWTYLAKRKMPVEFTRRCLDPAEACLWSTERGGPDLISSLTLEAPGSHASTTTILALAQVLAKPKTLSLDVEGRMRLRERGAKNFSIAIYYLSTGSRSFSYFAERFVVAISYLWRGLTRDLGPAALPHYSDSRDFRRQQRSSRSTSAFLIKQTLAKEPVEALSQPMLEETGQLNRFNCHVHDLLEVLPELPRRHVEAQEERLLAYLETSLARRAKVKWPRLLSQGNPQTRLPLTSYS